MGSPFQLRNPVTITALAAVSVTRGVSYIGGYITNNMELGPTLPGIPLMFMGVVWVISGLFLLASMWKWSWFRVASAVMGGAYLTWFSVYLVDIVRYPAWGSLTSTVVYLALFVCVLTVAQLETEDNHGDKGEHV